MELSTESESYGSYGVTKDSLKASQEDNLSQVPVLISDKWVYPQNQNPIGTEGNDSGRSLDPQIHQIHQIHRIHQI